MQYGTTTSLVGSSDGLRVRLTYFPGKGGFGGFVGIVDFGSIVESRIGLLIGGQLRVALRATPVISVVGCRVPFFRVRELW